MHQTRKGQQWYFGMKLHIGVDSKTKLIHSMATTAANVHDAKVLGELLHGNETRVYGDQAYRGQRAVIREHAPNAKDFTNRRYRHRGVVDEVERAKNRTSPGSAPRSSTAFGVIKRVFGFAKVRYRGLAKNTQRLWVTLRSRQSVHGPAPAAAHLTGEVRRRASLHAQEGTSSAAHRR